jgi:sarcosine oxidase/L-pipecolate oxidase
MAGSSDKVSEETIDYVRSFGDPVRLLSTPEDFRSTMPEGILTGDFPNWRGCFREKGAGWLFARGALKAAYDEATRLGVHFIAGPTQGKVESLIYSSSTIIGAKTVDGVEHNADQVILSAGANSDLLFDFERQLRPTCWTLAHIQMTEEERKLWTNLPVLFNVERGFFMVGV